MYIGIKVLLLNFLALKLFYYFMCMYVWVCVHMWRTEDNFPPGRPGGWRIDSGCRVWWEEALFTEPFHWPHSVVLR